MAGEKEGGKGFFRSARGQRGKGEGKKKGGCTPSCPPLFWPGNRAVLQVIEKKKKKGGDLLLAPPLEKLFPVAVNGKKKKVIKKKNPGVPRGFHLFWGAGRKREGKKNRKNKEILKRKLGGGGGGGKGGDRFRTFEL